MSARVLWAFVALAALLALTVPGANIVASCALLAIAGVLVEFLHHEQTA